MAHPSGSDALGILSVHFTGLRLAGRTAVAELYVGRDRSGVPVSVAVLTGTAAADPQVRAGFLAAVGGSTYAPYAGDLPVHAADLSGARPWAAVLQRPDQPGAERLLSGLPGGSVPGSPSFAAPLPGTPLAMPPHGAPFAVPPTAGPPSPGVPGGIPGWASGPGQPPSPGHPPAPGPSGGISTGAKTALIAGGVVLLLVVVAGVFAVVSLLPGPDPKPVAGPTTVPAPTEPAGAPGTGEPSAGPGQGSATPGEPPTTGEPSAAPGEPSLRDVPPVRVLGPSYAPGEPTYTMTFPDWPFAFRTPETWGCLGGRSEIPDSKGWVCVDEGNPGSRQQAKLLLRPCETTCTATERRAMNEAWMKQPGRATVVRERTYYVETKRNPQGLYEVVASHFFRDPGGGSEHWQIGVYVSSPAESRDDVLKILNDVLTQAG
ncbi:hypothetical protein [Plantactinospora sp. B24E8]|uniref:hypothetical protein n=1 Tax=Plantactinospora sp. B24E8 TaxID=3153567 RepID=UPI00325D8D89